MGLSGQSNANTTLPTFSLINLYICAETDLQRSNDLNKYLSSKVNFGADGKFCGFTAGKCVESIRRLLAIHMGPDPPGMSPNNFSGVKYQHGTLPDVRIEVWSGATNKSTPETWLSSTNHILSKKTFKETCGAEVERKY